MDQKFPLIFFTILLVISVASRKWKKLKTNISTITTLPPGPWKLPIIGNMHLLVGPLPHRCLRDLAETYGPIMLLQLGQVPHVVISSAEMAKAVMKTHDVVFATRPFMLAANVLSYNGKDIAFAPNGESWKQLKKMSTMQLLSAKRAQSFKSIREEEMSFLIKSISSTSAGSPVNLSSMVSSSTNRITSRTAFHQLPKQQDEFTKLVREILMVLGGFSVADFFPSCKFLQAISGMMPKLKALHQETDLIFESIIDEHRARTGTKTMGSKGEADDLLSVLLDLKDHGNLDFPLTMENIKAVILDLFIAGNDTSASVIDWTLAEMVKNPRVMAKAQAEVRQFFDKTGYVEETSFHELKYLNLVVKESLRLHPPGPLLAPREAQESVEINGYRIPVNTKIIVNAWAIGRDPRSWTEPERFYPERFLDSPIDYKGTDFEFIPFGAGRRICPGLLYGIALVQIALANLLYHFDWELPKGIKPENLDMTEVFGLGVRRRDDLWLIPTPYHPSPVL